MFFLQAWDFCTTTLKMFCNLFTETEFGKTQTQCVSALGPETEEQIKLHCSKNKNLFDL